MTSARISRRLIACISSANRLHGCRLVGSACRLLPRIGHTFFSALWLTCGPHRAGCLAIRSPFLERIWLKNPHPLIVSLGRTGGRCSPASALLGDCHTIVGRRRFPISLLRRLLSARQWPLHRPGLLTARSATAAICSAMAHNCGSVWLFGTSHRASMAFFLWHRSTARTA